jgi:hypothetical protein
VVRCSSTHTLFATAREQHRHGIGMDDAHMLTVYRFNAADALRDGGLARPPRALSRGLSGAPLPGIMQGIPGSSWPRRRAALDLELHRLRAGLAGRNSLPLASCRGLAR